MTENINHFEQSLTTLLSQIGKNEWVTPLTSLEEKFRQLPEVESSFSADVLNMLHQLCEAKKIDPETPIAQLAAIRLSGFDCWTYRFYQDAGESRYFLDPLTSSAADASRSIHILPSNTAYPAVDIIKRWAREHLQ